MRRISTFVVIFICGFLLVETVKASQDSPGGAYNRYSKIMVNSKVVEALGKIGDLKARDVLVEALKSKEFFIRAYAAQALGRIQDKESIALLRNLLNDKNYLVRVSAAGALYELGQQDAEEFLFSFLRDDDPAVRAATADEMGRLAEEMERLGQAKAKLGKKFLPVLTEMLSKEEEYLVRVKLIEKLGENQFRPALEYIHQAMTDSEADVRKMACWATGRIGDKNSIPLLLERLDEEYAEVRSKAKISLAQLGEARLSKVFWNDIEDENPFLKSSSYVALAIIEDLDVLPIILKGIIATENPAIVRTEAGLALSILKPYLSKLTNEALLSSKKKYRVLLSENLKFRYKVDDKDLTLVLVEELRNENDPTIPLVLLQLNDKMAFPPLREALLQENPEVVATTAFVLGELKDKDAIDYLIEVFRKYGI